MTGIIEHDFSLGDTCPHCGTPKALQEKKPNCVPRWSAEVAPRATHTGQSAGDYAADDAEVISRRLRELAAERLAAQNASDEPPSAPP